MILTKFVKIKCHPKNIRHFKNLGYNTEYGKYIIVMVKHLTKGCHVIIEVKCDVCGMEKELEYCDYFNSITKYNFYACCEKCSAIKVKKSKENNPIQSLKKEILIDLYIEKKMTSQEVADYLNISKSKVYCNLKKYGLNRTSSDARKIWFKKYIDKNKINLEPFKDKIIDLYENQNISSNVICKEYNCSSETIVRRLKSWGIKIDQLKFRTLDTNDDKIIELYKNGLSARKISRELGYSSNTVLNRLKRNGIRVEIINPPFGCEKYNVNGIRCVGTYEKKYIENLFNNGGKLPINAERVKTIFGIYHPDFEFPDKYIEIKSTYTYDSCIGKSIGISGKLSDKQYRKIKWTGKNIKPVEIRILDKNGNLIKMELCN